MPTCLKTEYRGKGREIVIISSFFRPREMMLPLPSMKQISWTLTFCIPPVSLAASVIPGPAWASGPRMLLGWMLWKLVFINKTNYTCSIVYTLSYLIFTTLWGRYNKSLFVDKIIGSERLSNLAKITLHSRTGIEICNSEPLK